MSIFMLFAIHFWIIVVGVGSTYAVSPPSFDGNPVHWNVWVRMVQAYFALKEITLDDEKIGIALLFLSLKVATYIEPLITPAMTWEQFKTCLQVRYQTGDHITTEYLEKFRKARQTSDASSYCDYFNSLVQVLSEGGVTMTEIEKRTRFIAGLTPVLARMVTGAEPASLEQAQDKARAFAANPAVRSEYSANPASAAPPSQPPTARRSGSTPSAAAGLTRELADSEANICYALTYTDKDFAPLRWLKDTGAAYSLLHPTVAVWLGLAITSVAPVTLYLANSTALVLDQVITVPIRHTKTQVVGTEITFYLCPVPFVHMMLSSKDSTYFWKDGGDKCRAQSLQMQAEALPEETEAVIVTTTSEQQQTGPPILRRLHQVAREAEIAKREDDPARPVISKRRPRRTDRLRELSTIPQQPKGLAERAGLSPPPADDDELAPSSDVLGAMEALSISPPRELWGWREYYSYVASLQDTDIPAVPYIRPPALDSGGPETAHNK